MKRVMLLCGLVWFACAGGCRTAPPLRVSEFNRNVILRNDGSITLEGRTTTPATLDRDLRALAVGTNRHIVLHTQERAPAGLLGAVESSLRAAGYQNLGYRVFR